MEFLQRHLPRVYQAVQDAMNFLTNFTAQVFGAPPNAPQPRNARTNVPIQKESEGPPAPEETRAKKETDLLTSTPQLLGVTEENGDSAGGHPGDEDYRMQETDLRYRKSDPGGRLEDKITEDVDIVLHTTAEVTHSYQIKVTESTESKNIVQSIVNQEQVNPPDPLELKNKVLIGCEINVSQYEEEPTSRAENLEDNEPLGNSKHKVYKGGQPTGEPSSDRQYEESLFQPITLQSLSFEDRKQLVGTTGQEEEEQIKCLIEITTERGEYNITTEQEALVLEESIDSTVTLEFDVDNILDVIENNKKLVTPVDEPESSSSQGGDSRKTLEDLLETANRLAKHCDLFQKVEGQKESDTLQDLDETLGSMPASILSTDLGYTEEDLTSVNVSVTKSNFLLEQSENQQTHLEEETIKTQSLVLGQSDRNLEEEGKEVSAKDVTKPTNYEDVQVIEEHRTKKQEEKHQFKGSERQPNTSRKQKIKRRVHFSPSTEDLFKKSERASRNTLQMVCDEILEGESQPREDREQLGSSYIIKDLGQSPSKEREGNYLGGTTCSYDSHYDGQSTSEEEETNGINEGPTNGMNKGRTVWYDNYSAQAEHGKRCDSLETATDQNVHVDSKMEESFVTATDSRSTEEHLDHIPSSEETLSVETESSGNRDMSKINNEQTELFTENKNESHALRETMNKSEKESLAASDGTEDTVRKEDSFLEEEKRQVEYLLEEKKDLLECDPTHVKEFIDDIPQSSDTLDTKNVGLSKDFTDEQMKTDNLFPEKAILGQDFPTEDTQLENITHYSAHRDITETASAENELTLGDCSIQETDKIIKSEQDGKEVQDETFLSEAKDVLKSFEEQTRSSIDQFEDDTLLRQPVARNGDDEYPEKLHETHLSTSVEEICMSLVGDVELRDGPPSEEHKEVIRDAHFEGESEDNNETSTNEMEEQPEHVNEKQSHDYKHEGFPPETSEPQEEESKVKTGHIEVELLTEQQWVAEEPYGSGNEASLTEGHFTEQMQDGNSFRQLAPTNGSEECPEESYEPDQSASLNEPFHSFLDVSAQKSRILLLRKTSVRRRPGQRPLMIQEELADPSAIPPLNMEVTPDPESSYPTEEATEMNDTSEPLLHRKSSIRRKGQRPVTFQEELAGSSALPPLNMGMPPAPESSYLTEEATETSNASETLLRRKSTIRRRGPRPVTFEGEPSLPLITSAESPHPTEEPRNESTVPEQILHGKSSIHQHQGQHPVAFEDEPVKASPPVIMPQKMQVPHFLGGMPILSPAVAPTPELLHPAEERRDEGTTSEPMLRRKSSVRRSKGKQPVISEEQHIEPPLPVTAPPRVGVALFPGVPAHMTPGPAPAPSHPKEESREEKTASEELIKPKKGFLKHAGFGGAHPGMMQELQARLHKKKPKE